MITLGTLPFIVLLMLLALWIAIARFRSSKAVSAEPATSDSPQPAALQSIWPFALARQLREDIGQRPGVIMFVFFIMLWAAPLYASVVATYEWPRWRTSWQQLWPGIDDHVLMLPLIFMLVAVVSNWKRKEGRLCSGVILLTYVVLQIKASLPAVAWTNLGAAISEQPLLIVPPLWFALFLAGTAWIIIAMVLEFFWPTVQSVGVVARTAIRAYDSARAYQQARTLEQAQMQQTYAHQQQSLAHQNAMRAIEAADWAAEEQHQAALAQTNQRHRLQELIAVRQQLLLDSQAPQGQMTPGPRGGEPR